MAKARLLAAFEAGMVEPLFVGSGVVGVRSGNVEYRRWDAAPQGTAGWVADLGDGATQHLVLAVDGDEVVIVAASGPESLDAVAALVDH